MKYFKLINNFNNMHVIPEAFLLLQEYNGLKKYDHLTIEKINVNSEECNGYIIKLLNGKLKFNNEFEWYQFQGLSSEDILEMTLQSYLKLKAFL